MTGRGSGKRKQKQNHKVTNTIRVEDKDSPEESSTRHDRTNSLPQNRSTTPEEVDNVEKRQVRMLTKFFSAVIQKINR
jgi:hypothetical protein